MNRLLPAFICSVPLLAPQKLVMWTPPVPVEELLMEQATLEGLRVGLVEGIAWRESRFEPRVWNRRSGCAGIMGLKPRFFHLRNIFDAEENIKAGTHYLGELVRRYGSEAVADCAYSWGAEACGL